MTNLVALRKGRIGAALQDIVEWPTFDEGALEKKKYLEYINRKKGVEMYARGHDASLIKIETGFSEKYIYRLITERCLATHQDGRIYGWRGLIPNVNINGYKRKNKVSANSFGHGCSGALDSLFVRFPEVKESFNNKILNSRGQKNLDYVNQSSKGLWLWFLNQLKELGLEIKQEWPFDTDKRGYVTITKYIKKVLAENPAQAVKVFGKQSSQKITTGDGTDRPIDAPLSRVEMDAHLLDGHFCILVPDFSGDFTEKIIHRVWVIVLIDVYTRVVLGYHLSLGKEVNKFDVLKAIRNSVTKYKPSKNFSDIKYCEDPGFPSMLSDKYIGLCWDEMCVDGALAENCTYIEHILNNVIGSKLISPVSKISNYAKRRNKDDRPNIEAFFRNISTYGFQKLSNTSGKDHKSKRENPQKIAIESRFQLEYAEELLGAMITEYNNTPHSSLGYRSPLEYFEFTIRKQENLRYVDQEKIDILFSYRKKCQVKGNLQQGRKPYINFEGARYNSEILGQRFDLIGSHIWVSNHLPDDARVVMASTENGDSLGILRAAMPWHKHPHSLRVRKHINSAINKKIIHVYENKDAVSAFMEFAITHKTLPTHPAYLELQRILVNDNTDTSDSLVNENSTNFTDNSEISSKENKQKIELSNVEPGFKSSKTNNKKYDLSNLPARRKIVQG